MIQTIPAERVPDALRVALFSAKVSQQQAATLTGYSSSAISRRLAGDTPITLEDLTRIASAAGLEAQILLTPADSASPHAESAGVSSVPSERRTA